MPTHFLAAFSDLRPNHIRRPSACSPTLDPTITHLRFPIRHHLTKMDRIFPSIQAAGIQMLNSLDRANGIWKSPFGSPENPTPLDEDSCKHPDKPCFDRFRNGLPTELWYLIIRHALEPRFALMLDFLPQKAHFFHICLLMHPFSCPDRSEIERTKASLKLVCHNLKAIVDGISSTQRRNSPWIMSYNPDTALRYGPCVRLDACFDNISSISDVKQQYPHEVDILSIVFQYANGPGCNAALFSLLMSPWTLKVLHLSSAISHHHTMGELPLSILGGLPSLQVLSVASSRPFKLFGKLAMPKLKSLFLTCVPRDSSDTSQWVFPELEHLVIDTRGWPAPREYDHFNDQFGDLLWTHSQTIKSLKLIPVTQTRVSFLSNLDSMPRLEALATDFVRYVPRMFPHIRNSPVVHLIHISTRTYTRNQISNALLATLKAFPLVRTLTITEHPFLERSPAYAVDEDNQSLIHEVDALCRSRGIRIIGKAGDDTCCISKVYEALKPPLRRN